MTGRALQVGVVGAGITGVACALAASRAGAHVDLYETQEGPPRFDGAIDVAPNMLRDLVKLGVGDGLLERGFPYRNTEVRDAHGQVKFHIKAERLAGRRYPAAVGITYDALIEVLASAALASGVNWRGGQSTRCVGLDENGPSLVLDDGRRVDSDLIVLASGADSSLRAQVFPNAAKVRHVGQTQWRALAHRPQALNDAVFVIGLKRERARIVPVDAHRIGITLLRPALPRKTGQERNALSRFQDWLAEYPGSLREAAHSMTGDTEVEVRPVKFGLLPKPWHRSRVLAVGEFAHAITPHFGQSAAQSVEDAVVLGELLRSGDDVDRLCANFAKRRYARARAVHDICLQATRWDLRPRSEMDFGQLARRLSEVVSSPP